MSLGLRPRILGIHVRQITSAQVKAIMQHFLRLIAVLQPLKKPLNLELLSVTLFVVLKCINLRECYVSNTAGDQKPYLY